MLLFIKDLLIWGGEDHSATEPTKSDDEILRWSREVPQGRSLPFNHCQGHFSEQAHDAVLERWVVFTLPLSSLPEVTHHSEKGDPWECLGMHSRLREAQVWTVAAAHMTTSLPSTMFQAGH